MAELTPGEMLQEEFLKPLGGAVLLSGNSSRGYISSSGSR